MALPLLPFLIGVISVSTAAGLMAISWSIESVEQVVDDTKIGSNLLFAGLGVLALGFGLTFLRKRK